MATYDNFKEDLDRIEKKIDSIHSRLYENGLVSKVDIIWEWRKDFQKIMIGIVTSLILTWILGSFVIKFNSPDISRYEKLLEAQEEQIKRLIENKNQDHGAKH